MSGIGRISLRSKPASAGREFGAASTVRRTKQALPVGPSSLASSDQSPRARVAKPQDERSATLPPSRSVANQACSVLTTPEPRPSVASQGSL